MSSRAWTTTGPNLSTYQPDIEPAAGGEVVDGKSLTVNAPAEGTSPVLASVSAEVVQIRPDNSAIGRISLGSGKDATLSTAAVATYCTLGADECECPIGSDGEGTKFTPMEKGSQYVTVTGGLGEAGVRVRGLGLGDFCAENSPLIGTWRSKSTKITADLGDVMVYQTTGAAGVTMTIGRDGTLTVTYDGMKPAFYRAESTITPLNATGEVSASGTDRGTLDLDRALAGAWKPEDLKLGLVAVTRMNGGGTFDAPPGGSTGNFVGPMLPGSWKIVGKTLTVVGSVKNDNGSQRASWIFTRVK